MQMPASVSLLLGASGLTALVVGLWSHIKNWATRLLSHVIVINVCPPDFSELIFAYLHKNYRRSPFEKRSYTALGQFVRSIDRNKRVAFRVMGTNSHVFWKGWRPIWTTTSGGEGASTSSTIHASVTFSFIRGTFDWDQILGEAIDAEDAFMRNRDKSTTAGTRYSVRHVGGSLGFSRSEFSGGKDPISAPTSTPQRAIEGTLQFSNLIPVHYGWNDLGPKQSLRALDFLSLCPELEEVVEEIRFWFDSRLWYQERGIPWRRGYLFHGAPGTGKTSLARGLAEHFDMPVTVFDLTSMTNRDLIGAWRELAIHPSAIALFEDIDGVFKGRENLGAQHQQGPALTFDCLLNCLDGVERNDGILTIVTTNNLAHLDRALLRPGRVDRQVAFRPLDANGRYKIAYRILQNEALAHEVSDPEWDAHSLSAAAFQERCIRLALDELFARERKKKVEKAS
jgi:hypothetical protein